MSKYDLLSKLTKFLLSGNTSCNNEKKIILAKSIMLHPYSMKSDLLKLFFFRVLYDLQLFSAELVILLLF